MKIYEYYNSELSKVIESTIRYSLKLSSQNVYLLLK